jgi:CBS domain containing-hemolysin-like protein
MQPFETVFTCQNVKGMRFLVTGMRQAGVVHEVEAHIARRAFQFGEVTARELMARRLRVATADWSSTTPR